jgi:PleD family two-component response regulator
VACLRNIYIDIAEFYGPFILRMLYYAYCNGRRLDMVTAPERILIVDDEEIIRFTLTRKLSKEGYRCQEAESAAQAVETMKKNPSELMILPGCRCQINPLA